MKKQFAIKSAQVVKNIKNTVAKNEATSKLNFSLLTECCPAQPGVGFTGVFSL